MDPKTNGTILGIDIGGTFTDCVLFNSEGEMQLAKVPSSRTEQARCVMDGWKKLGVDGSTLGAFQHGSTAGTNALIERRVGKGVLVTTKGMRDILVVGRGGRGDMYNLQWDPPVPLIERQDIFEVEERVLVDGSIQNTLDEDEAVRIAKVINERGYQAVGIVFLHSYRNSAHEDRMKEIILKECPHIMVCTSSEVLPQYREFERTSTTVVNTVLMPTITGYIEDLVARVRQAGFRYDPLLMQGSGGLMTPKVLSRWPARLVGSGPAGGVMGCSQLASLAGVKNVITLDMGGTSTDVSLIIDGVPKWNNEMEVEFGVPVRFPAVDIKSVGAGGGSIGWIDVDGSFKVGPSSAGAEPGPACYGQGGISPTITDAQVMLGRLDPGRFLGGEMQLKPELSRESIDQALAKPLGITVEEAARGMLQINTNNMINAVRVVTVEKGYDPREFALMVYGGGGPMFGAEVAKQLGISKVVVPPNPGLMCALGITLADHKYELSKTLLLTSDDLDHSLVEKAFQDLERQTHDMLEGVGIVTERREIQRWLDLRYEGQAYEISVPVSNDTFSPEIFAATIDQFHNHHHREYGYEDRDSVLEVVYCRVFGAGKIDKPVIKKHAFTSEDASHAVVGRRKVYFADYEDQIDAVVYDRSLLSAGCRVTGPAVLEQMDTTTIIPPNMFGEVDEYLNLIIFTDTVGGEDFHQVGSVQDYDREHLWQIGTVSTDAKDPVMAEVMRNAFLSVVDEMNIVMEKSCYSPANKEGKDLSGVLSDRQGHIVCQGWRNIPIHCGSMEGTVTGLVEKIGVENFHEGDAYILNCPFIGGTHIQDVRIIMPAFHDGILLGFLTSCGHWQDMGGAVPGSYVISLSEAYAEGLRFVGTLAYSNGEVSQAVLDQIDANTRIPRMNKGDMLAQIAAVKRGGERLAALAEKYGAEAVISHMLQWQQDSTDMVTRVVSDLPDGRYEWEDFIDQDPGSEDKHPVKVKMATVIAGNKLTLDFSGTDPTSIGCMNASFAVTQGACMVGLKCLFPLPFNYGTMRAIDIIAPEHTVVNASLPANVQGHSICVFEKIVACILGSFSEITPERTIAGCGNLAVMVWGTPDVRRKDNRYCVGYFWQEVGYGAAATKDGITPRVPLLAGWAMTIPVEVLEKETPLIIDEVEIIQDSGGPGEYRGFNGMKRIFRFMSEGTLTLLGDRAKFPPKGLFGGRGSATQAAILNAGTPNESNLGMLQEGLKYKQGDTISLITAGGGGRGQPWERDPEAVLRDVVSGYVSISGAREDYGVVLAVTEETPLTDIYEINLGATEALRNAAESE